MISSDTNISATIDWLSVTATQMVHHPKFYTHHIDLKHGQLNYDCGIRYLDGRVELWHSRRPEMKVHLVMSGDCISRLCQEHDLTVWDILNHYSYTSPSRVDLAVDITNGTLNINDMAVQLSSNQVDTKAEGGLLMSGTGNQNGMTLYVGSPGSDRRLRVYDKAAETGKNGEWTRIELQLRQRAAKKTFITLMARNADPLVIPGLINDFASWPEYPDWCLAIGSEKVKMSSMEKVVSNRRAWIFDTCAKAIANELQFGGDAMLIGHLLDAIEVHRDVLREKIKT